MSTYRSSSLKKQPERDGPHDFAAPLGSAAEGRLTFVRGASLLTLAGDPALADLFRARFEGPTPQVRAAGGDVTVRYRRLSLAEWARFALLWGRFASTIQLNTSIPWLVDIRGGVSKLDADLRALRLSGLLAAGGASEVAVDLPAPAGLVTIRISGGASHVTLRRPASAAVRVVVGRGASQITLDAQHYGAVGGTVRLETPGGSQATNRYDIEVAGGASHLTVDTWR
jgi:hypothetical protein